MKTKLYTQRFSVPYEYQVWFTTNLFDPSNTVFRDSLVRLETDKRHRILIFIDEGVVDHSPDIVEQIREYARVHSGVIDLVQAPVTVPGGEQIKVDMSAIEMMQSLVFEHHIDRHSFVVGIGGGAMLDAVGWVAATAHRGVRHIRIPTTVLAQNDSGVGVKNGVNLYGVKNYMGSFAPPFAVLNDIEFVMQLPRRDRVAGISEAVKVALIRDEAFFGWLENNLNALIAAEREAMQYMIQRCAELHMHQIAQGGDPFEMGSARPLDYGHWSAHKLESMTDHQIRHGEAVAIGIALDARYSMLAGLLQTGEELRIYRLLEKLGFELWHPALEQTNPHGQHEVLSGLKDFKEHLGGELTITLLDKIGVGVEVNEMDDQLILESIEWLKSQAEIRRGQPS